jgi:hypothetical protein
MAYSVLSVTTIETKYLPRIFAVKYSNVECQNEGGYGTSILYTEHIEEIRILEEDFIKTI